MTNYSVCILTVKESVLLRSPFILVCFSWRCSRLLDKHTHNPLHSLLMLEEERVFQVFFIFYFRAFHQPLDSTLRNTGQLTATSNHHDASLLFRIFYQIKRSFLQ